MLRPDEDIAPFAYPVLIADIGGTNARFALIPDAFGEMRVFDTVPTSAFPSAAAAVDKVVLSRTSAAPRSCLLAVAGPATPEGAKLTNADWMVEPHALIAELGLTEVVILNDFEALALALPSLSSADMIRLGDAPQDPYAPRIVVGPGTGLGVAALVPVSGRAMPIAGEGGHVCLGPETDEEFRLWPHLPRFHGRISAEALLSGDGLARIHAGLRCLGGEGAAVPLAGGKAVTDAARAGEPTAVAAVELFCRLLGRVAGDLALVFLARGGVYVGGGIVPQLADLFHGDTFRAAFEAKAPHEAIMHAIPSFVITRDRPALEGLAALARTPTRFALSLTGRRIRE